MILAIIVAAWIVQSVPFGLLVGAGFAWAKRNDRPEFGTSMESEDDRR